MHHVLGVTWQLVKYPSYAAAVIMGVCLGTSWFTTGRSGMLPEGADVCSAACAGACAA